MTDNSGNARIASWIDSPLARPAGEPAVRDVIGAGFTHAADGPYPQLGARGFEAGGPADLLPPCSVLAELTGQVLEEGAGRLTDDELVGVLRAARRVVSWQQAVELAAVAELTARRAAEPTGQGPSARERASAEVAVALTLTGRSADMLSELAVGVRRLTDVDTALRRGEIDIAKASVFVEELAGLDWLHASVIAGRHVFAAPGLTTGQLRQLLRRAVMSVDPDAVRRRQHKARDHARLETWSEGSGNGALAGRELPPARTLLADRHVRALAQALQRAGMPGTLDQICAEVFLALLSGESPESLLAAAEPRDDTAEGPGGHGADEHGRRAADEQGGQAAGVPGECMTSKRGEAAGPGGLGLSWPRGPLGTVHLTMPLGAWLGITNSPGEAAGRGVLDAWSCREVASSLAGQPGSRYCLTVTTPDGHPVGHACSRTPPPGLARDGPARPPPGPPGTERPGAERLAQDGPAPPVVAWIRGLAMNWLESGSCSHARETAAYVPGRLLGHLIKVRNPTCTAPGCRRPAQQSDLDHVIPYAQGGRTCECNCHPACRRHHRCKGSAGWHLEMPEPGTLVWRLPHGRRYVTRAQPYPV
ncbi:MAG TPA: DUF222 domain-containing protein [Streptosporangiaceae bacterium]|nr:DUF222 domain-containing protein [Streptosporangiaceae bacterium]